MKVLVIGGAGFIGSHTVDALLARGFGVRVLDNFSSGKEENLPACSSLEVQRGDIRNAEDVQRAMRDVTHVLHLAAQVSVQASVEDPVNSCASNIMGFVNVLDAARRAGVRRFVYASSAAVYGVPQVLPLSEAAPVRPLSPYGLEKYINDQYAAMYRELFGMNCLGMRYFNVYGPRQDPRSPYAGVISKFIDCVSQGVALRVHGDGLQTRDFVYVEDVAQANLRALESDLDGVCNIGTGQTVTLMKLIETIGVIAGCELAVIHEPPREGDIRDSATAVGRMEQELGALATTGLLEGLAELMGVSVDVIRFRNQGSMAGVTRESGVEMASLHS
jgi:UDP-glucose 4-epimerase